MSIVVSFQGQRRSFKCPAGLSPVQTVFPQIAAAFGVDAGQISLIHRGKRVEPSQPFSMSGLMNNSEVELVLKTNVRALPVCLVVS